MRIFALRLHPGQDLLLEVERFIQEQHLEAACILTCVGSLRQAVLRYANQDSAARLEGKFEIVSLTGVMSHHGSHYHISIADTTGRTIGAHLLEGCLVYTTAEIVVAEIPGLAFKRSFDPGTGYPELDIQPTQPE